jgi:hypothetical protein
LEAANTTTIVSLFATWRLLHVPVYVNRCIEQWAQGEYAMVLMHSIPSPRQVLYMQSRGERVASALLELDELTTTHSNRDALDFLLHDFQHFDKFVDHRYRFEQVGTFWAFAAVDVQRFFAEGCEFSNRSLEYRACVDDIELPSNRGGGDGGYDAEFWHDLDYIVSDMNACCIHLLGDLKAKHVMAEARKRLREGRLWICDTDASNTSCNATTTLASNSINGSNSSQQPSSAELSAPILNDPEFVELHSRLIDRLFRVSRAKIIEVLSNLWQQQHGIGQLDEQALVMLDAATTRCIDAASRFCTPQLSRIDAETIRSFMVALGKVVLVSID